MIIFDIDDTISPTRPGKDWKVPHETARAWAYTISIPTYVLEFLRSRDDIALLSTWGKSAQKVADAFGFTAQVIVLTDEQEGIQGKYDAVNNLDGVVAWVDDHMKPAMRTKLAEQGILGIKPTNGVISKAQLATLVNHVS